MLKVLSVVGFIVGIVFLILQLTGAIVWPWGFVLLPFAPLALLIALRLIFMVIAWVVLIVVGIMALIGLSKKPPRETVWRNKW